MRLVQAGLIGLALLLVAGCGPPTLRQLNKPGEGPDEFRIVPGKPLAAPGNYAELPAPTPGGTNLTDPTPLQDSAAVLGGNRSTNTTSIPGTDGAIVNHASRYGRDGAIRETLASQDADFRRRRGRLTNIRFVREDRYNDVYRKLALNPDAEQARWRRAGARTPSAPPAE